MFKIIKFDIYRKIFKLIKKYNNIVIARHISPDPDAIAGQIGLRDSIKLTFPTKNVYAVGAGVSKFRYLGSLDKVDVTQIEHALLVVLDVPNFERTDGIDGLQYDAILKIDHHPPLDIIGDVDWTDDTKSSTCEMLINLLLETKLVIDLKIANALYTGMVFDSDRFLLGTTTVGTFLTVTKLLNKLPVDITSVYNNLYYKDMSELKFYAYLIDNIKITDNKFGYIYIEKETLDKYGMDASSPSHFVNDFYYINQLVCWAFVTYDERLQLYKINIRSNGPEINEIANKYDGGGHKLASGCRIKKKSDVDALMKDLDAASKAYNDNE